MKVRYSSLLHPNAAEDDTMRLRPLIERTRKKKSWEEAIQEYEERPKLDTMPSSVEIEIGKD
jgi:hypothetical protein